MGIPLVNHESHDDEKQEKIKYPNQVDALGSPLKQTSEYGSLESEALEPSPYEYVDALNDIQENSIFSIENSWIIYDPKNPNLN